MTAAMLGMATNPYFRTEIEDRTERARGRQERMQNNILRDTIIHERKLHTFTIQGHTIEAYSKRDAIKRLKHKGLIK